MKVKRFRRSILWIEKHVVYDVLIPIQLEIILGIQIMRIVRLRDLSIDNVPINHLTGVAPCANTNST